MTTKPEYARQLTPWEIKQINGKSAPSSSSVDSKTPTITQAEVMERHDSLNKAAGVPESDYKLTGDKILASDLQRLGESIDADLANRVDLDKFQHEENQEYIAELLEEIADKADKIEEQKENAKGWERKFYEANGNWESWRSKCMDAERKIEKLKVELEVETSNRKYAEKLMDEALINAQRDEALLAGLAAKFVDVRKRNLEGN